MADTPAGAMPNEKPEPATVPVTGDGDRATSADAEALKLVAPAGTVAGGTVLATLRNWEPSAAVAKGGAQRRFARRRGLGHCASPVAFRHQRAGRRRRCRRVCRSRGRADGTPASDSGRGRAGPRNRCRPPYGPRRHRDELPRRWGAASGRPSRTTPSRPASRPSTAPRPRTPPRTGTRLPSDAPRPGRAAARNASMRSTPAAS